VSAKARNTGRMVCPESGVLTECAECEAPFPHVREEWVQKGQRVPACETHKVKLERAEFRAWLDALYDSESV
jgi:hypothetical protein